MENLLAIWQGLTVLRRAIFVGSVAGVILAIALISRFASAPNMVLLYAGLDNRAAGEIMAALDARTVSYQVRGDSLYVDQSLRDALRMSLAAEGLPAQTGGGYELLDQLAGFSTTSQMFDVAYWRAKEGELARTILAVPGVRSARVHIGRGPSDVFKRATTVTASVTVTSASGSISAETAMALRHLIASSVSGMQPKDVDVIDTVAGLIGDESAASLGAGPSAQSRAAEIKTSVERLLAARVGAGNAVVEVAVDLETQSETISERLLDPVGRVAISAETQERNEKSNEGAGAVGVASNLPDAEADTQAQSQLSETRERINYEVSQTNREISKLAGSIKRITMAVLVDDQSVTSEEGVISKVPRSPEELTALRDLVASAAGIDESRGDILTLESLEFLPQSELGSPAVAQSLVERIDLNSLLKIAVMSLAVLGLGFFVIRPIFVAARSPVNTLPEALPLAMPMAQTADFSALIGGGSEESDLDFSSSLSEEEPSHRLRRLIGERQSETIEVLRNWLEPEEEKA